MHSKPQQPLRLFAATRPLCPGVPLSLSKPKVRIVTAPTGTAGMAEGLIIWGEFVIEGFLSEPKKWGCHNSF